MRGVCRLDPGVDCALLFRSIKNGSKKQWIVSERSVSKPKASTRNIAWEGLLKTPGLADASLQSTLKINLAQAVLDGIIPEGARLPSTRSLASTLGVARVTVTLAYEALQDQGLLVVRERSGHYVSDGVLDPQKVADSEKTPQRSEPAWPAFFAHPLLGKSGSRNDRPRHGAQYSFLEGGVDKDLFPFAAWRECSRLAQSTRNHEHWTSDLIEADDPFLLEQLCNRVLPRRGIIARPEEILITMGSQMGTYLVSQILVQPNTTVAFEEPGSIESRNIFAHRGARMIPLLVDDHGAVPLEELPKLSCIYCTPGNQSPTGAILSMDRRHALLELAHQSESLIIEDDHESETTFYEEVLPALKAMDRSGHVIFISSFSNVLAPGLRLGYIVAHPSVIERARQLRRMILRHPPGNNQRALALFIAHGHYEQILRQQRVSLRNRAESISKSLRQYRPDWDFREPRGGSALWIKGPEHLNMSRIKLQARERGVLIESGGGYFHSSQQPSNFARLHYSSIDLKMIDPGIQTLAKLVDRLYR
jgi:GntR family transcriptional regulator/MocR family aminotransferase